MVYFHRVCTQPIQVPRIISNRAEQVVVIYDIPDRPFPGGSSECVLMMALQWRYQGQCNVVRITHKAGTRA